MQEISEIADSVNHIITDFDSTLYTHAVPAASRFNLVLDVLCGAKGEYRLVQPHNPELNKYRIDMDYIDNTISKIKKACGDSLDELLPFITEYVFDKYYPDYPGFVKQPKELTDLVLSIIHLQDWPRTESMILQKTIMDKN